MEAQASWRQLWSLGSRIPRLCINLGSQLVALKILMLLHPALGLYDLIRIGCGRQNLGHQGVRVECDGRDQLL